MENRQQRRCHTHCHLVDKPPSYTLNDDSQIDREFYHGFIQGYERGLAGRQNAQVELDGHTCTLQSATDAVARDAGPQVAPVAQSVPTSRTMLDLHAAVLLQPDAPSQITNAPRIRKAKQFPIKCGNGLQAPPSKLSKLKTKILGILGREVKGGGKVDHPHRILYCPRPLKRRVEGL